MPAARFFDSNLLIYVAAFDARRTPIAEKLFMGGGIVSVQVLNEVANVCAKKLHMPPSEIFHALETIRSYCTVVPLTDELPTLALSIMQRYQFSYYDSLIVASALAADCTQLYTEDLQHGQKIGKLRIVDPFGSILR